MATIMKSLCFTFIILASSATLFSVADAWRFNVGGNGEWTINPKENYKTWAERNRFQVNDTLYFKYAKGSDSVQQVMKSDFEGCNVMNPIKKFEDGESVVSLNRSGPFYFISGNQDRCKKGQKLIVVVLAIRNHTTVPVSPAKPPTVAQPPKSPSPVSPVAPAKPPTVAQPPKSHSPVSPPKSSVSPTHPPKSSSPVSHSPSIAPSHAPAKSPATPSPSPSPKSPSPASSPSSPDQSPTSSPPPEQTPPTSPTPSETTPTADNVTAPAPSPKKSAGGKVAVTSVMATVISLAFTVLMFA